MIEVIPFRVPKDVYNRHGVRVERKGEVVVSHGVDHDTGRNVILPCEPYDAFVHKHCRRVDSIWILKE